MKFKEFFKGVGRRIESEKIERLKRLSDPVLQVEIERTQNLLKEDIINACREGLAGSWRFTLGAPLSALLEGSKELGSVVSRNMSVKNPKNKRSYSDVPAATLAELLTQYGKGTINIVKMVGHLSLALGRGTVLGGRYLIGK